MGLPFTLSFPKQVTVHMLHVRWACQGAHDFLLSRKSIGCKSSLICTTEKGWDACVCALSIIMTCVLVEVRLLLAFFVVEHNINLHGVPFQPLDTAVPMLADIWEGSYVSLSLGISAAQVCNTGCFMSLPAVPYSFSPLHLAL